MVGPILTGFYFALFFAAGVAAGVAGFALYWRRQLADMLAGRDRPAAGRREIPEAAATIRTGLGAPGAGRPTRPLVPGRGAGARRGDGMTAEELQRWWESLPRRAGFLTPPGECGGLFSPENTGGLPCRPGAPEDGDDPCPGPGWVLVEFWAGGTAWVPLAELATWRRADR